MSLVIIPLAGPDFYSDEFGIRPLYPVGQSTLIEYVLSKRKWILDCKNQIVFILRLEGEHTKKMHDFLTQHFPLANIVTLGSLSAGASFSALAGISLAQNFDLPVVVDLADIAFDLDLEPSEYFKNNPEVDAVVPYFHSDESKFSYLKLDGECVIEAREKQVISTNASAGVYIFRDVSVYLRAMEYSLKNPEICRIGKAFFVCPSINGLITKSRQVRAIMVKNAEPIGEIFHKSFS